MRSRSAPLSCILAGFWTLLACAPANPSSPDGTAGSATAGGGQTSSPSAGATTGGSASLAGAAMGGTTSTGGGSGAAGANTTAGVAGRGSSADPDAVQKSAGCGKPSTLEPAKFLSSMLLGRATWLRLPAAYDETRPYPLIFLWKGCSTPGVASFGMEKVGGEDAILVEGDFPPGADCYDTADGSMFTDLPLFDALLAQTEQNFCVDQAHVFSVGFSSGAWLTQLLGCQRGDVLRGIGTIAGAFKPAFLNGAPSCKGNGLSAFMVSDLSDHTNPFYDEDNDGDSVEIAVNHWLNANGCTDKAWTMTAGTPAAPDESVCRAYAGCGRFPVELCLTTGVGHAAQEPLSMPGSWSLFQQSLPK